MRHWRRDKADAEFINPEFVFARQFENLGPEMLDFIGAAHKADLNQRILSRLSKQPFEVIKGSLRFRESLLQQRIVRSRWQRCEVGPWRAPTNEQQNKNENATGQQDPAKEIHRSFTKIIAPSSLMREF